MRHMRWIVGLLAVMLVGLSACAPSASVSKDEPIANDALPLANDRPTLVLFYKDD